MFPRCYSKTELRRKKSGVKNEEEKTSLSSLLLLTFHFSLLPSKNHRECPGNITLSMIVVSALVLTFFAGCPAPSEWDQQWEAIQTSIRRGDFSQAKTQLQTILPSIRQNDPFDTRHAQIIYQLGDIARLEGDAGQAETLYWKALPLIAESLGPEHLHMADPLTELATIYQKKDQPKIALPLLKRALAIREKTWGASDRKLLPTLKQYHILLMRTNDQKEGVTILTRITRLEQTPS